MKEQNREMQQRVPDQRPRKPVIQQNAVTLMGGLAFGHGVKHIYQQGFLLLIPSLKGAMLLTDVQVGLLGTVRTIFSAAMNLPAGVVADLWRTRVGLFLAASLSALALGYLLIGLANSYWVVLVGVAITGLGTSLWHAPAFGTLGALYPDRRATAIAVHRTGGSVGDTIAPILMGLLLGGAAFWGMRWSGLHWQTLALILVGPALISALAILIFFRRAPLTELGRSHRDVSAYLRAAGSLLRNNTVLSMVVLTSVRAMAHGSLNIFLVVYMSEDLGFREFEIGYHMSLLVLLGVGSAPLLGWISDKVGRRPVIAIGLTSISIFTFALIPFGSGIAFTIILACLGIFLHAVNPIMLATAMDAAPRGTESSATATMFTGPALFGAISPVIAGHLRESYGMDSVFLLTGAIVGLVAIISLLVPISPSPSREPVDK